MHQSLKGILSQRRQADTPRHPQLPRHPPQQNRQFEHISLQHPLHALCLSSAISWNLNVQYCFWLKIGDSKITPLQSSLSSGSCPKWYTIVGICSPQKSSPLKNHWFPFKPEYFFSPLSPSYPRIPLTTSQKFLPRVEKSLTLVSGKSTLNPLPTGLSMYSKLYFSVIEFGFLINFLVFLSISNGL